MKQEQLDIPTMITRGALGLDRLVSEMERSFGGSTTIGYPPHNIIKLDGEGTEYRLELAIAGFSMDDLSITVEGNLLRVEGRKTPPEEVTTYLHRGISGRNFRRDFVLAEHMEVPQATLENGILCISVKRKVPEALKPRRIDILQRS